MCGSNITVAIAKISISLKVAPVNVILDWGILVTAISAVRRTVVERSSFAPYINERSCMEVFWNACLC